MDRHARRRNPEQMLNTSQVQQLLSQTFSVQQQYQNAPPTTSARMLQQQQQHQAFVNNVPSPLEVQQSHHSAALAMASTEEGHGQAPSYSSEVVDNRSLNPPEDPVGRIPGNFVGLSEYMQKLQAYVSQREDALNQLYNDHELANDLESDEETRSNGTQDAVPLQQRTHLPNGSAQPQQHQQQSASSSNGPHQPQAPGFGAHATGPFQSVLGGSGLPAQAILMVPENESETIIEFVETNQEERMESIAGLAGTSRMPVQQSSASIQTVQNQWTLLNGSQQPQPQPQPPASATANFNPLPGMLQLPSQLNHPQNPVTSLLLHQQQFRAQQLLAVLSPLNASRQYVHHSNLHMARNAQSTNMQSTAEPILNARQMQYLIIHSHVPVDELTSKGLPEHMITSIEENREQLQQLAKMQTTGVDEPLGGELSPRRCAISQEQHSAGENTNDAMPFLQEQDQVDIN